MASSPPVEIVQGAWNTTQVVVFPSAGEMFTDPTRMHIVNLSLQAHALFVDAAAKPATDPSRMVLLRLAIQKRIEEKALWLALTPPDKEGGWKADLAMASYQWEETNMLHAFDTLTRVRNESPANTQVHQMALQNLQAMYRQVRLQLPSHETPVGMPSVEVLGLVRQFWEWVSLLPDGKKE